MAQLTPNSKKAFRKRPKTQPLGPTPRIVFVIMGLLALAHSCITGIMMAVLPSVLYCLEDIYGDQTNSSSPSANGGLGARDSTLDSAGFHSYPDYSNNSPTGSRTGDDQYQSFPYKILQDKTIIGNLISACSWGQPLLCIITSLATYRCKRLDSIYFAATGLQGLLFLPIPIAFWFSYKIVYALRFMQGAVTGIAGALLPSVCELYGARLGLTSAILVLCTTVSRLAGTLPMISAGGLCRDNLWPLNFYIFGGICLLFAGLGALCLYFYKRNYGHTLGDQERFVETNCRKTDAIRRVHRNRSSSVIGSFASLMRTYSIYALCQGAFSTYCVVIFMNIFLPKYFADVFGMPLKNNRWYIIWPPIVASASNLVTGIAFDESLEHRMGTVRSLKLLHATATLIPSILMLCMVLITNLGPNHVLIIQCAAFAFLVNNNLSTYRSATMIYPNNGMIASGLIYTSISASYITVPYVVELLVDKSAQGGWLLVMSIFVTSMVLSCASFMFIKLENDDENRTILSKSNKFHMSRIAEGPLLCQQ